MEATKFLSTSTSIPELPRRPFSPAKPPCRRRAVKAFSRGSTNEREYGDADKLVDENMIVLQLRIREMKMVEECNNPPSHWMDWEKEYFEHHRYISDVCEAVGLLQCFFMNVRPSLALGLIALVTVSVPISSGVVLFYVVEIAKMILSGFRLG